MELPYYDQDPEVSHAEGLAAYDRAIITTGVHALVVLAGRAGTSNRELRRALQRLVAASPRRGR